MLALILLAGAQTMTWTSGSHEVDFGGISRRFILEVPAKPDPKAGLILAFHGFTDSPESLQDYSGLSKAASELGFYLVYPEGTKDREGKRFFQVGYQFHSDLRVNDVEFARWIAQRLTLDFKQDPERVFATGMSNGGDMSYYLACQTRPFVKAIAPIAGTMMKSWADNASANRGISVLAANCTTDRTTLYEGDILNIDGWGAYLGVDSIIAQWSTGSRAALAEERQVESSVAGKTLPAKLTVWRNPETGAEIRFYKVLGGSHDWPTSFGSGSLADTICDFFKSRP
jgi:polyhydroxybutyrate depolymerase